MKNDSIFEEYKDLYKLTGKTADDHIEFYKNKESLSEQDLFTIWKKLHQQATNFDEKDWTENWPNWHKNWQGFERHKFEAKFLIQNYLTDVLEELISRLVKKLEEFAKMVNVKVEPSQEIHQYELPQLIKKEVKRLVKEEIANQKRKTKNRNRK